MRLFFPYIRCFHIAFSDLPKTNMFELDFYIHLRGKLKKKKSEKKKKTVESITLYVGRKKAAEVTVSPCVYNSNMRKWVLRRRAIATVNSMGVVPP